MSGLNTDSQTVVIADEIVANLVMIANRVSSGCGLFHYEKYGGQVGLKTMEV